MIKKSVLAAGLAALAFAALPAIASATYPNPYLAENGNPVSNTAFTVAGGAGALETVGNNWVKCTGSGGEGEFVTSETGWIKLKFTGCKTKLGLKCGNDPEAKSEIITTTELTFHLKTVDHGGVQTPGVLITPGAGEPMENGAHFVTFECQLVGKVVVGGNKSESPFAGIVGTITSPEKGVPSNTATLSFKQKEQGIQTHSTVTNDKEETVKYILTSSLGGGATEASGEDAEGIITFANGMEPELLTTP